MNPDTPERPLADACRAVDRALFRASKGGNMKTYAQRLRHAMEQAGVTQIELAQKVGISQQSVHKLASNGKGSRHTHSIARALGISTDWLERGEGGMFNPDGTPSFSQGAHQEGRFVPVLDSNRIQTSGGHLSAIEQATASDRWEWVGPELEKNLGRQAFAWTVEDRRMEPVFERGDVLVIDPSRTPEPGSIILARIDVSADHLLGRMRDRGRGKDGSVILEMHPENPDYPYFRIYPEFENNRELDGGYVIGCVVQQRKRLGV
ncbi:LexA family transcriptional regulator [Thioalkalivibrio sp. ALE19]|uniref:LexA family protein n=1 Tax=Thioalkalivibrio sp. ALE19 TaxID=1266909 RepID=UPI0012DD9788|nr:LexA family transcriptional regulator [Thioalkalivibrio sp. ALE19]